MLWPRLPRSSLPQPTRPAPQPPLPLLPLLHLSPLPSPPRSCAPTPHFTQGASLATPLSAEDKAQARDTARHCVWLGGRPGADSPLGEAHGHVHPALAAGRPTRRPPGLLPRSPAAGRLPRQTPTSQLQRHGGGKDYRRGRRRCRSGKVGQVRRHRRVRVLLGPPLLHETCGRVGPAAFASLTRVAAVAEGTSATGQRVLTESAMRDISTTRRLVRGRPSLHGSTAVATEAEWPTGGWAVCTCASACECVAALLV